MEINTTVGCPLNCRACPQKLFIERYKQKRPWETEAPKQRPVMMSLPDYKTCVDKLPPDTNVHFAGWSEPQLNPAFVDMVLYAHEMGHPVDLFSTFVGMTRESYERIRTVPFNKMVPHIPDAEGNTHFSLSTEYLELLDLVIRDTVVGRFRITGYSCHGSVHPAVVSIFEKYGVPVPTPSNLHDRAGNVTEADVRHNTQHLTGRIWCSFWRNLNYNVLLPDGTVCLCCNDCGMDCILGNLLTQSYEDLIQGEAMQDIKRRMKSVKHGDCICRRCFIAERATVVKSIRRTVGLRTRVKALWQAIRRG